MSGLATRRRLIVWTALRSVLIAAVLVVLYYELPLDRPWDSDTAVRLLIGLLIFAGVVHRLSAPISSSAGRIIPFNVAT